MVGIGIEWLNGFQVGALIWIMPVPSTVTALFCLPGSQHPSTVGAGRPFIQWPADPTLQFLIQHLFPLNHLLQKSLQFLRSGIFHHLVVGRDNRLPGFFFSLAISAPNSRVQLRRVYHQIAFKVFPGFNQREGMVRTASHQIGICIVLPIILPAAKRTDLKFTQGPKRWVPTKGAGVSRLIGLFAHSLCICARANPDFSLATKTFRYKAFLHCELE